MKVEAITLTEEAIEDRDYREALIIKINDSVELEFVDGELEDANLNRDFSDCKCIIGVIKQAYTAGKNGEELELKFSEVEEI